MWRGTFSLEQREAMIRETAYSYFVKRGYTHGHDLDDWLATETELERGAPESQEFPLDIELQQNSVHRPPMDEKLKQIITQGLYYRAKVWCRKMHRLRNNAKNTCGLHNAIYE